MSELHPDWVTITHPDPGVEDSRVPPESVGLWRNSGWQLADGQDTQVEELPPEAQRFEGQPQVRIYHPELDRVESVAESAVPQHRSQGWLLADEAEAERLEAKNVAELRELAKERGISPIPSTKADLLEALQQTQDDAGEPAPSEEDEG